MGGPKAIAENMTRFREGDIVLILCDFTIGRIEWIHQNGKLHNIRGLNGFKYPNQYANEIVPIKKLDEVSLEKLKGWL